MVVALVRVLAFVTGVMVVDKVVCSRQFGPGISRCRHKQYFHLFPRGSTPDIDWDLKCFESILGLELGRGPLDLALLAEYPEEFFQETSRCQAQPLEREIS